VWAPHKSDNQRTRPDTCIGFVLLLYEDVSVGRDPLPEYGWEYGPKPDKDNWINWIRVCIKLIQNSKLKWVQDKCTRDLTGFL
jgi:hypothetical protein